MQKLAHADLPVSRWHNGAGRKADIANGEGWMLGFAWLDAAAPFSDLAGYDRTITLVEGPGFTLDIAGREALVARTPFVPQSFDGGAPTQCRIAGPSKVLNVMTARGRLCHRVSIGGRAPEAPASFLVVLQGSANVSGVDGTLTLGLLDSVRLEGAAKIVAGPDMIAAWIAIGAA